MGITPKQSKDDINRELLRQKLAIENGIIIRLRRIGQQFMINAKSDLKVDTSAFPKVRKGKKGDPPRGPGLYLDQTANLRSSIGFFVLKNGEIIDKNFEGSAEGMNAGEAMLNKITRSGYQLVGVAGMDYASYVESKGFNVITSQSVFAITDIEEKLKLFANQKQVDSFNIDILGANTELI